MESNNIFSSARFYFLMRRHFSLNYKTMLIAFLGVAGILALIGALSSIGKVSYNYEVIMVLFYVTLFIAGFIITGGIFNELHKPERSIHFLTLPASNFEKLISAWLNTTIIYLIFSLITFYISYFLSSVLAFWWFKVPISGFNIFQMEFLKICWAYVAVQSVFFYGALFFRGHNFLKTILALFLLSLASSILNSLVGAVAFREVVTALIMQQNVEDMISAPGLENYLETYFLPTLKILVMYVMPVFFLGLSYFRIKEREV